MTRSDKSLVNLALGGGLAAAAATFFLRPDTLFPPEPLRYLTASPRPKKRRVADPAKKRQRKAQRTARRINRKG